MRVHYRDHSGVVVSNPPDIYKLAMSSRARAASVILAGSDLIASTVPLLSHHEAIAHAGVPCRIFCPGIDDPPIPWAYTGTLFESILSVDIWTNRDLGEELPCSREAVEALFSQVRAHPRLRCLSPEIEMQLVFHDFEGTPVFIFNAQGMGVTDEAPVDHMLPRDFPERGDVARRTGDVPRLHFPN